MTLQEKLDQLPVAPGVYLMKDAAGGVLYVGKALSLRSRVRSYFQPSADLTPRIESLVSLIKDLGYIIAQSETEALALEFNLIHRHKPRFNVRYRDDKSYPYLRIDLRDEFPALCMVRRLEPDGARYFGPYPSAWAMWETIRLMRRVFKICQKSVSSKARGGCTWKPELGPRLRPCLNYHLGRCLGPCAGAVGPEEYRRAVLQVADFLAGKRHAVTDRLRVAMEQASTALDFERAARLRDQVLAIEQTTPEQRVVSDQREEADVIGYALQEDMACLAVLQIREGRLIAQDTFLLEGVSGVPEAEVLNAFAKQHYQKVASAPRFVYLPTEIEEAPAVAELLGARRESAVKIVAPRRGAKRALVSMAMENAEQHLGAVLARESAERRRGEEAVADLQRALHLGLPPRRVEAFDISNIQGKAAVGSMIVFEDGHPKRSDYRRFRIHSGDAPDDYAMMHELLSRRLKAAVSGNVKFARLPDLLLVDGGQGQLNVAVRALATLDLNLPVAGLAKEHELVYLPGAPHPMALPAHSRALHLLQRVRDEAHRFALAYHRSLRAREVRESVLDAVPGVGEARKRKLLSRFGSITRLRQASVAEIAAAAGCGAAVAESISQALRGRDL
jgi:excinuclease ABC subunit C